MISPLCSTSGVSRVSGTGVWRAGGTSSTNTINSTSLTDRNSAPNLESQIEQIERQCDQNQASTALALPLVGPGELLPRIAEEKDSPTNTNQENLSLISSVSDPRSSAPTNK